MPKIFISHISQESELAKFLKQQIVDILGIDFDNVFVSSDGKSLSAGSDWLAEIDSHLAEAQIVIILCSKESIGRPWVNFEAGVCWFRKTLTIPVCHSGMLAGDLPIPFKLKNAIEVGTVQGIRMLFETIQNTCKSRKVLSVNYASIVQQFKIFELEYIQKLGGIKRIENPRILCAASEQYSRLEFDLDIKLLTSKFSNKVVVDQKLTSKTLRKLLTSSPPFDIIHLVIAIDDDSGDLIFSDVDSTTHKPTGEMVDRMSPNGFATLIQEAGTSLVVLATCNAYPLAIEVASATNMIAANKDILAKQIETWSDFFYDLLKNGDSLYKAFKLTRAALDFVPLRLIQHSNVTFIFPGKDSTSFGNVLDVSD